mgnify:CR=1 FL=1
MKNKLNYLIMLTILFTSIILAVSIYFEINIEEKMYSKSAKNIEKNSINNHKEYLRESIKFTEKHIDTYFEEIEEDYQTLINIKINEIKRFAEENTSEELSKFISNYQNNILKLTDKNIKEKYYIYKQFILKNKTYYIFIEDELIKKELLKKVKKLLYKVDLENKKYIWINEIINFEGGDNYAIRLIHPNMKKSEMNFLSTSTTDIKGNKPYLDELKGINKNKEVYSTYFFKEIDSSRITKKISYAKLYKRFNWVIATGVPLTKLNAFLENEKKSFRETYDNYVIRLLFFGVLTIVLFSILLFYLVKTIYSYLEYNMKLQNEINDNKRQKDYQDKLLYTERQYRELFYNNGSMIMIIDPDNGNILNTNKSSEKFYGYSHEEFLSLNIIDINILSKEELDKKMSLVISGDENEFILKHKLKNASIVNVKIHITLTKFNQKTVLYTIMQDVSKDIERESNWNNFFSLSMNLLLISDTKGTVIKINSGWKELLGYEKEELIGKAFIDFVHPHDIQRTKAKIPLLSKGEKIYNFENRYIHKDGTYRTISWSTVLTEDKKLVYSMGQDITELKNKNYLLSQQSKMAAMGEMLGNIAHQWRQPLSVISTLATGTKIKKEMDTLSDKDLLDTMVNINETTQFLSNTIDDFRNFFNHNKIKTAFKVQDSIDRTLNLISAQFHNHEIIIIQDIEEIEVYALENEFLQVLINILNNSRDVLIEKRKEDRLVFINIYKKNSDLIIKIKDNGYGVDNKAIEKIFEPYFTTKHKSQGTGIGLYMCEEIITKHMAGSIRVENSEFIYEDKEYRGAEFTIVIPI